MNPNPPPDFPFALFAVGFPAFFATISLVFSMLGGWGKLAQRYKRVTPITGTTWWLQSAGIRRYVEVNYGNCLIVTVNDEGIGLSVLFPFRLGHPPLFIPWSEVLVAQVRRFFLFNRVRLTFPEEASVRIDMNTKLAERIQKAIGHSWFEGGG